MLNQNQERELAYVTTIDWVRPIEGADNIELIGIKGWTCIAKKEEFKTGDLAVYFEIDSKLPEVEWAEFLAPKKYKVKTMKLSKFKVVSQGLALPANAFGWELTEVDGVPAMKDNKGNIYKEGDFLTQALGVKYSVDEDNIRKAKVNPDAKINAALARHPHIAKKYGRLIKKNKILRSIFLLLFGRKSDNKTTFPTHFQYVKKSDEERCLFAKTKIATDHGDIEISNIVNNRMNVKVLSMNKDGTLSYKRILDYQKFDNKDDVLTITYPYSIGTERTNSIVCTPDHRFYTQRGYIHAKDLKIDDNLYMPNESYQEDCIGAIYGMLLGDSHIYRDKRCNGKLRVVATNGEVQLNYLQYKKSCFSDEGKICDAGIGSYGTDKTVYHWFLPTDGYIDSQLKKDFYINNKKTVTKEVCNKINEVGLAFWYMDDGSLTHRDGLSQKPSIRMNTQGFSKEENDLLCNMLNNRFGIPCHPTLEHREGKPDYYHIYIDVKGTPKFLEMITPYMCTSMAYKTLPKFEKLLETKMPIYKKKMRVLPVPIIDIKVGQHKFKSMAIKPQYVYDLEIEDNHNFISANIVSHNCENMPDILQNKTPFVKTTKIDGTSTLFVLERKPFNRREFYVCSRNVRQLTPSQPTYHSDNVYWSVEFKYHIKDFLEDMLKQHPDWTYVALQGETAGVGEDGGKIQGDPHKFGTLRFFGYNFIDSEKGRWGSVEAKNLTEPYGIEWVPIVDDNYILPDDFEEFKLSADGPCEAPGASGAREGYVYRNVENPNISFKNVSRKYLLKHSE